jgi:sulfur relay (sulfurtransferase) complex TusBCD TusD component (DsrE family)
MGTSTGMKSERLASIYRDPGPFASAYLEISRDQEQGNRVVELAVRAVAEQLAAQGAPSEVVAQVQEALGQSTGQPAPISRCVVASERGVLFDELTRSHHAHPVSTWSPLPDVAAWLRDANRQVPFVLALVDHEGGDVTTYSADDMDPEREASVGEPSKYEHKVRGGGWSHLNWQRSAETVWARNAAEVAAEIERQVRTGPGLVILAGDEHSRSLVTEQLPDTISAQLRVLDRAGRPVDGGDDALAADVESVLRDVVVARQLSMVHELKERMGRGESFAIGVRDVADAFVLGQVDQLLLDPEAAADFTLQPSDHPGLALGINASTEVLRADQALIAAACLTDADIAVTTAATMGGAPVAALLRWNQ